MHSMRRLRSRTGKIQVSRREFFDLLAVASAAFAAARCDPSMGVAVTLPESEGGDELPVGLESLGGAPNTHQGRTIAAFCDVVVPGKKRDPSGAPGAVDVGAPAIFFDHALPAAEYVGLVAFLLDAAAKDHFDGQRFADIKPEEREEALNLALKDDSPLEFAVQLAKVAFFSGEKVFAYLGYPGPNDGYIAHPDFTFGVAMAREITKDGNYP